MTGGLPGPGARADALVVFGATGDLARKKLYPALYQLARPGQLGLPIVGVALSAWDDDGLRRYARASVEAGADQVDEAAFGALAAAMTLVAGHYADPATFTRLSTRLGDDRQPALYLAIPPAAFGTVARGLAGAGLNRGARVVVEKPFGRDLESARELNAILHPAFGEPAIFRIDHYLGKESVENLLAFRFSNTFLEPVWNRNYVASVQSPWPGPSASRDEACSTTAWAPSVTWSRTPCCRSSPYSRWSRPRGLRRRHCAAVRVHQPRPPGRRTLPVR